MKDDLRDHAPGLERAFACPPAENDYRIDVVEGKVPSYVRGTYYVIGPARFARGGLRYRHWLDGDGLACALHLGEDGARFVSRYVRGTKLITEEARCRPVFRTFGTAFPGDRLKRGMGLESPLNVSLYPWQGSLLAFGEQGLPWALDPITLDSRGEHDFGGRLNAVSPFAAHPSFDPESGEMVNFGVSFAPSSPSLTLYHVAPEGAVRRRRVRLEHPASIHDFALTRRYAVFYVSPYLLDLPAVTEDGLPLLEALRWRPELGSRLLVVERRSGEVKADLDVGRGYCLHVIGAFEDRRRLVIDVVELDRPVYDQYAVPQLFPEPQEAEPARYVVAVEASRILERRAFDYRLLCDFPHHDPRCWGEDYRHFWMLGIGASRRPGRKFFDQLVHGDWHLGRPADVYRTPEDVYLGGEPAFVADPTGTGAGAVLCPAYDARRHASSILVFDAFDVGRGPLATVPLKAPIPPLFHATFKAEG